VTRWNSFFKEWSAGNPSARQLAHSGSFQAKLETKKTALEAVWITTAKRRGYLFRLKLVFVDIFGMRNSIAEPKKKSRASLNEKLG